MARLRIGELLVTAKVISADQLERALGMERPAGQRLGDLLVQLGHVTEAQLTQTLSQQLSVPWVSLYHIDFSRQLLNLVPRSVAESSCLVPIYVRRVKGQGDTLYVAMDDPTNEAALVEVSQHAGLPVKPMIASPTDIRSAIRVYYGVGSDAPPTITTPNVPTAPAVPPPPPTPPTLRQKPPLPARAKSASKSDPEVATAEAAPPAPATPSPTGDSPDAAPEIEAREVTIPLPRRGGMPMVALTMLDGTTIQLPARRKKKVTQEEEEAPAGPEEPMTARDLVRALRAAAQGTDMRASLGEDVRWEPVIAAIIAVLLKKGLVADWELIEEFKR